MFLIYGLTLILLSLMAVPSLVLSKKPNAQELYTRIAPYQGWIGVIFCIFGIVGIIQSLLVIGSLNALAWITWFSTSIIQACLGFILGYNLIFNHILSKSEKAKVKGEQALAKLLPLQGKLGIVGICLGAWCIIAAIFL